MSENRLKFIKRLEKRNLKWYSLYQCACGKEKVARESHITSNKIRSCGCFRSEVSTRRMKIEAVTHGMSNSSTYMSWTAMKSRCLGENNIAYDRYKDLGVWERWLSFENFLEDMGERPEGKTLDRLDNTQGYSKDNCRWADWNEQAQNRRTAHGSKTFSNEQIQEIINYHGKQSSRKVAILYGTDKTLILNIWNGRITKTFKSVYDKT